MARVLITGSTDGIGRAAATTLLNDGHDVVMHGRSAQRLRAVDDLLARGAQGIVGDLSVADQVHALIEQTNALGPFDAVIHNAAILAGPPLLQVNVLAPYMLTAGIERAGRLVYLSSSMHRGGRPDLTTIDWSGSRGTSYSDSKLFVTALMAAVARLWPGTLAHAVARGWVPTRMGGPSATDDLRLGHCTQVWLATTEAPEALVSGRYWHHQRTEKPHAAVHDEHFQDELLRALARFTGMALTTP